VFRHLFRAAEHADRMTLGELPLEPLPVVRNDEVGHLIAAFNRLLVKLNGNQAELARIAHHDTLTGLPNRALLSDRLQQLLAQAQRKKTRVGLLFLDLDGFKHINDTLGHKAGDEVLRKVASRFAKIVREADTLARVGGDEFVLLLSDLADNASEAASIVAMKCINALQNPFSISGTTCGVGVSIGIALGSGSSSADALLMTADHAMYDAKKAGRGQYVIRDLQETAA
jgi:diguanylate cyclase (GGDEF)-like protein